MEKAFNKFHLTGKTAYVTGGGTGLGYFIARALARSGAKVMIGARREEVLKAAAQKISQEIPQSQILYHPVDLSCRESIEEAIEHATSTLDGVDIFVGNAAQDMHIPTDKVKDEDIDQILQVNLKANIALTRGFLPGMRANKWGRLLFSSSITSHRSAGDEDMTFYATSKAALNGFSRSVANEYGRDGVTANSLILGVWWTEMLEEGLKAMGPERAEIVARTFEDMTSLGRLGQGEELEGLIQLLASDAGSYITGTESVIDGGMDVTLKPFRKN